MAVETRRISPDMTLLDIISAYPLTEAIIKKYDESAGVCLCCKALFEPLRDVATKYGLNLHDLFSDLKTAAQDNPE